MCVWEERAQTSSKWLHLFFYLLKISSACIETEGYIHTEMWEDMFIFYLVEFWELYLIQNITNCPKAIAVSFPYSEQ